MFASLLAIWLTTLYGCASSGRARAGAMFNPPSVLEAVGDWDDVAASVRVGAEQSEMVVVRQAVVADTATAARFELRTSLNEPVVVEARRVQAAPGNGGLIMLRVGVGRFGDESRERAVLANIARRLTDLRGVEFAPIRE